jgi:zinc and cadmium transporter
MSKERHIMTQELTSIILATFVISSGSFIGVLALSLKPKFLGKIIMSLVSLSAGTMLGAAFLHLIPESIEMLDAHLALQLVFGSFVVFFLLERFLHWRHCHTEDHVQKHTLGIMNLIGDGVHNFLDGLLIAAAFASGDTLGLAAAFAIILHEVPQEIGDFGVLIHSGFSRAKALWLNILVGLTAVLGGLIGYYAIHSVEMLASYLVPIAAGGFLYIGASDLLPEIKNEKSNKRIVASLISFGIGILLMLQLSHH